MYGNTSFNTRNLDSRKSPEESSRGAVESSQSSQSCDEHLNACPDNFRGTKVMPSVDQDSDDSDSEIFRVKRRSTQKVDKRNTNDGMSSMHSDHQVFKLLIGLLPLQRELDVRNLLNHYPIFKPLLVFSLVIKCSSIITILCTICWLRRGSNVLRNSNLKEEPGGLLRQIASELLNQILN